MKTKEECIRAFAAAGFPLIPLAGKKPLEDAWETTPTGKHDEKTLAAVNYGIVLGPAHLVCDLDPRNYTPGDKPLDRLAKAIGGIPPSTLVTRTGGGGLHIFLTKPAEISVRNSIPEYPGIEFKAGPGRQVVGPFSVHPNTGAVYRHLQGRPSEIAPAPEKLLALIRRLPVEFGTVGTAAYQDDDATKDRCASFLKLTPAAIQGLHGDDTTLKAALGLRDRGVSPRTAYALMAEHYNPRCVPPWEDGDLAAKVQHAYQYARGSVGSSHPAAVFTKIEKPAAPDAEDAQVGKSGWKLNANREPRKCFQNTLNYFSLSKVGFRGCFGYNEFARRVEILKPTPWGAQAGLPVNDIDLVQMRAHLAREHGYDSSEADIIGAMVNSGQKYRFHPVKEFLSGLRWDGTPRLDSWLTRFLGVEDDAEGYARAVGRKTLVAAVARIFEPGIKFDSVLVLEGRQGLGKSGVVKVLGGEWSSDFKMNAGEKDTVQMMQGKWIVEMAELHTTRTTDLDTLKAFLTREVDEARFAYGRLPGRYPRQGIFIATYNPGPDGTYLKDEENRRWWPVMCNAVPPKSRTFDFAGLKAARDQMWAEAVALYRKGEELKMHTDTLEDAAKTQQRARRVDHPWTERVAEWVRERDKNLETRSDFYTGREVYVGAMNGMDSHYHRREQLSAASTLKDLGWVPGHKRRDGDLVRGFYRSARAAREAVAKVSELAVFGDLV